MGSWEGEGDKQRVAGPQMDSRHPICRLPAMAVVTVVARMAMVARMAPSGFRGERLYFFFYDFYYDFVEHVILLIQFSYGRF